jgi:hypothetical protein
VAETETEHVSTYAPVALANRFRLAARREGYSTAGALRVAMQTYAVDVAERDGAARAGATPSTTSEVAEPVGASR